MAGARSFEVETLDAGLRLDRWFRRRFPDLPHGKLQKLLRTGQIRVDGARVKANARLSVGQVVRVPPFLEGGDVAVARPRQEFDRRDADRFRRLVIYEDEAVIVIDKPAGLAVQGGSKLTQHVDQMLTALASTGGEQPRLVHRIDKDTSGILVLARTAHAAASLTTAFRSAAARKVYWTIVVGAPKRRIGLIDLALAKRWTPDGERVLATTDGKPARTRYAVMDTLGQEAAWLALAPLTGRTHQLRVHCAESGMPIFGDPKYGVGAELLALGRPTRLHLHARAIDIPHPNGKRLRVVAPVPASLRDPWRQLGFQPDESADPFVDALFPDRRE